MANQLSWADAFQQIAKGIVQVCTQHGVGTGFLLTYNENNFYGIATAHHVIAEAAEFELSIKLMPAIASPNAKPAFLYAPDRHILRLPTYDDAVLISCVKEEFPPALALTPLNLIPDGEYLNPGDDIAWAGFSCITPEKLSFFHGYISCHYLTRNRYYIDGNVINGVSGGPAFTIMGLRPGEWVKTA
jgi:hypothetical protein